MNLIRLGHRVVLALVFPALLCSGAAAQATGKSAAELFAAVTGKDAGQARAAEKELLALGAQAAPAVAGFLEAKDTFARMKAVELLGKLKEPKVADAVAARLADPKREVCAAAAEALTALGDPRGRAALLAALGAKEPDYAIFRALGTLNDNESFAALVATLRDHRNFVAREWAAEALATRKDARAAEPLAAAARDMRQKTSNARGTAVKALGDLGGPEGIAALGTVLTDPKTDVRGDAGVALASIGTKEAFAVLDAALADPATRPIAEAVLSDYDTRSKPKRANQELAITLIGFKWVKELSAGAPYTPAFSPKKGYQLGVLRFRARALVEVKDPLLLAEVFDAKGEKAVPVGLVISLVPSDPRRGELFIEHPFVFPAGAQPARCTIQGIEFPLEGLVYGEQRR